MTSLFGVKAGVETKALLGILGTTALLLDGKADDSWGKPRERAVLATLAVHVNKVVSIDTLIRWAWPADTPVPQNPTTTFHTYAARIRRALRRLPTPTAIRAGNGGYRLEMDRTMIDHHRFRDLVAKAATLEPEEAIEVIDAALMLWRGVPLEDVSTPAAEAWRSLQVQNQFLGAHTTLIEQLVGLGRFDEALTRLDDLHADYPDDVTLATLRLSALYGDHRRTHGASFYLAVRRRLQDLGDDQAAEHLRQHHDALRLEHGKVHSPAPARTPRLLPHDRQRFVGRDELLGQLDEAVTVSSDGAPSGVVIVDGAGGVGKTALVVHWAHRHRQLFPDGDLFVNLYGYAHRAKVEHSTVVDDFLMAMGKTPGSSLPPRGREELLRSLLSGRRTLVVLDNVRDSAHIEQLLPLLSNSLVIVTSRQWLTSLHRETGARRITVPPLTDTEGAELISAELGPGRELDERHRHDLVELCGGLPLLLTVLAGNLAGKSGDSLAVYSALLDRRQLVLGLGDHGDGPVSGAACLEPSYLALPPAARRLFRLLTLHPGPEFGVDAACACDGGAPEQTALSLSRLAGIHLLEETAANRYRFHDVVAEFAAYCRDRDEAPGEQAAAVTRVLDHYLGSAIRACGTVLRSYNPPPALRPATGVHTTVFADADDARQWFARERTILTSAITFAAERGHHDHAWRLADPVTTFLDRMGSNIESRDVRRVALASTRAVGDREAEVSTLNGLGMTFMKLGDTAEAHRCFETTLRLAIEDGTVRGQASSFHQLARLAFQRHDMATALDLFHRGLAIDQASGNKEGMCWAHCRIGQALHATDQHDLALSHLNRAAWFAQEIGEVSAQARSLREIAAIHRERGELDEAISHSERALELAESVPDLPATAEICVVLCEINIARHRSAQAIASGRRAVEVCEKTHDLASHARSLEVLGNAQHNCGDLVDAVVAWQHAVELYDRVGNAVSAGRLRNKIDTVPIFYQEVVPLARSADETGLPTWPSDEVTQPLNEG
jgi:DNA-binding SARP family transcriptional activator